MTDPAPGKLDMNWKPTCCQYLAMGGPHFLRSVALWPIQFYAGQLPIGVDMHVRRYAFL